MVSLESHWCKVISSSRITSSVRAKTLMVFVDHSVLQLTSVDLFPASRYWMGIRHPVPVVRHQKTWITFDSLHHRCMRLRIGQLQPKTTRPSSFGTLEATSEPLTSSGANRETPLTRRIAHYLVGCLSF